jgi:hypothetical protein
MLGGHPFEDRIENLLVCILGLWLTLSLKFVHNSILASTHSIVCCFSNLNWPQSVW